MRFLRIKDMIDVLGTTRAVHDANPPAGARRGGWRCRRFTESAPRILKWLQDNPGSHPMASVAAALDMPYSTVQRGVRALKRQGLVASAGGRGPRAGVRYIGGDDDDDVGSNP